MPPINQKSLVEWLDDRCPPFLAIALARTGRNGDWIKPSEIAAQSGISERTIWRLFSEVSWKKHTIFKISRILEVCRIDVFHMARHREYMADTLCSERPYNHIPRLYRKRFMRRMGRLAVAAREAKAVSTK